MGPSRDVSLTSTRFGSASDTKDIAMASSNFSSEMGHATAKDTVFAPPSDFSSAMQAAAALVQKRKVVKFALFVSALESYEVVFTQWLRLMLPLAKESSFTDYMECVSSFPRVSSHVSDAERVSFSSALDHYHAETNYYQQLLTGESSKDFISLFVPSRDIEVRLAHSPGSLLLGDYVHLVPVLVAMQTALRLISEGALTKMAAQISSPVLSERDNAVFEGAFQAMLAAWAPTSAISEGALQSKVAAQAALSEGASLDQKSASCKSSAALASSSSEGASLDQKSASCKSCAALPIHCQRADVENARS